MDLEPELLKSISKDELERQVSGKIEAFHGFLTREVAIRLIAKEKGLLKIEEKTFRLSEIPKGEKRITFSASVKRVWPVASYSSGKKSRVVDVEDETGAKPLVLWNGDVELASKLRAQDKISVRGAYEKNNELHLGYSGSLEIVDKAAFSDLGALADGETVHLRGVVSRVEGYDGFVRGTRTVKGFAFIISDGKNERRCVVFEGMERAEHIRDGDEMIIESAGIHNGNIEIGEHSRMLARRSKEMLLGEITVLESAGDALSCPSRGEGCASGTRERPALFGRGGRAGHRAFHRREP